MNIRDIGQKNNLLNKGQGKWVIFHQTHSFPLIFSSNLGENHFTPNSGLRENTPSPHYF